MQTWQRRPPPRVSVVTWSTRYLMEKYWVWCVVLETVHKHTRSQRVIQGGFSRRAFVLFRPATLRPLRPTCRTRVWPYVEFVWCGLHLWKRPLLWNCFFNAGTLTQAAETKVECSRNAAARLYKTLKYRESSMSCLVGWITVFSPWSKTDWSLGLVEVISQFK